MGNTFVGPRKGNFLTRGISHIKRIDEYLTWQSITHVPGCTSSGLRAGGLARQFFAEQILDIAKLLAQ